VYKLLVVDDHPYQVDSIAQTLEQSELQLDTIFKAYSGTEALETMSREPIDIVITDIRMPEMNGIELIERIRAKSKQVKCILLSGYAEFEYAQQALVLQTSKYLMKPVETSELLRTMETVISQLSSERQAEENYRQTLLTLRENLPRMRSDLLQDLLKGKRMPRAELERKLQAYRIPFAVDDPFSLMVVQLEDDLSGYTEYDISLILFGISNMAEECFKDSLRIWHARISSRRLVVLIHMSEDEAGREWQTIERTAKELQRLVYTYLKHIVSIGLVRSTGTFPSQLRAAYESGMAVFNSPEGKAAGFFAGVSDLPAPVLQGSIESLYRPPSLMSLMETDRWREARARLDEVFEELSRKSASTNEYILEAFYVIAGSYQFAAHMNGKRLSDAIGSDVLGLPQDYMHWDLKLFQAWAVRTFQHLEESVGASGLRDHPSLIDRIHQFIDRRLEQELSLQSISDEVGLHPAYLSKIYKQETGVNLSDYVLEVRMAHSAELLKNTECKIYEVSARVGYQTPHYFIKLFKKAYGMTPVEYRNRYRRRAQY